MKSQLNKYLYYFGLAIFVSFFFFVNVNSIFEKTKYNLIVYNNTTIDFPVEGLKDPNHRIHMIIPGVSGLDIPDNRIKVSHTPLYVLIKHKSKNIEFVTDKIDKLNDYLQNEIK